MISDLLVDFENVDASNSKTYSLNANLTLDSNYASVDFKSGNNSITNTDIVSEFIFSTKEVLTSQINTNVSLNFKYTIVITDIDDFGIRFNINN